MRQPAGRRAVQAAGPEAEVLAPRLAHEQTWKLGHDLFCAHICLLTRACRRPRRRRPHVAGADGRPCRRRPRRAARLRPRLRGAAGAAKPRRSRPSPSAAACYRRWASARTPCTTTSERGMHAQGPVQGLARQRGASAGSAPTHCLVLSRGSVPWCLRPLDPFAKGS